MREWRCGELFLNRNDVIVVLAPHALNVNDRVSHLLENFVAIPIAVLALEVVLALRALHNSPHQRTDICLQDILQVRSKPAQTRVAYPSFVGGFPFREPLFS